ncbi:hypothetical protein MUA02_07480 [Enterobacteriaceae bacterium H20N1]|uniref:Uncharacterized protein n=1 Tax=Dryocola boscaweniae TaxID=2925397 RepID=A0A9X3AAQ6_9ENTR|nr:hypothetical protein [Dryocola boscaweniae]MCT4701719.1 hypothetical protein [Dryocola boscaweniae]MCT4718888.1 hypothetical protein [Dryocola boscaweniae]
MDTRNKPDQFALLAGFCAFVMGDCDAHQVSLVCFVVRLSLLFQAMLHITINTLFGAINGDS